MLGWGVGSGRRQRGRTNRLECFFSRRVVHNFVSIHDHVMKSACFGCVCTLYKLYAPCEGEALSSERKKRALKKVVCEANGRGTWRFRFRRMYCTIDLCLFLCAAAHALRGALRVTCTGTCNGPV